MTLLKFFLLLLLMWVVTFLIGLIIVKNDKRKKVFMDSVIFMHELIKVSPLTKTGYNNILDAFHDFNQTCRSRKVYRKLFEEFKFKYEKFFPDDMNKKLSKQ